MQNLTYRTRRRDQLTRFIAETRQRIQSTNRAGELRHLRDVEHLARVELEELGGNKRISRGEACRARV